jgi:4-hydroxyphenylacetate 3-monooxygenase
MKTGAFHIQSLRDGRTIFLEGRRVADVTSDPAFRNIVATSASFYDYAAAPENRDLMTVISPTSGEPVSRAWHLPRTYAELVERRRCLERIAELSCGMVGRSPDHVASTLSGLVMGADALATYDARGAKALQEYFGYARDRDLYLTYVIINPQADRSKSAARQPSADLVAHIVDEDHEGITIKGGKMLATSAMAANEMMISNIQPLREGDERYAFTAVVPVNAKGLKLLSRRSYEQHATSQFDFPLASRFDENDAVVYFDEVKIPWERVFLLRNIAGANAQWHATRAHVYQNYQGIVRLAIKLRFLLGIARKIAETNGIIGFPQVRETLGELASKATMIEAMVAGMEASGEIFNGYFVPNRPMLCAAQAIAQKTYPQIIDTLRELSGGGLIMLPSSVDDFHNPEIAGIIQETQKSPVATSVERVKLFKLAWDAVGSEFGSRHLQYEKFYSGASLVLNGHNFNYFDWQRAVGMVDGFMSSYGLPEGGPAGRAS